LISASTWVAAEPGVPGGALGEVVGLGAGADGVGAGVVVAGADVLGAGEGLVLADPLAAGVAGRAAGADVAGAGLPDPSVTPPGADERQRAAAAPVCPAHGALMASRRAATAAWCWRAMP